MNLSPTAQEAHAFLSTILPVGPFVYCASSWAAAGSWTDTVCNDLLSVVQKNFADASMGHNTYFGLSAFTQGWHSETRNGKQVTMFRSQDNATVQKCLWLDIDCGKAKDPYPSAEAAVRALSTFLTQTRLPVPYIVNSGHGIHIYWPFDSNVTALHWRQMSSMLRALCVHHGFMADHSRTVDPSSVLRLPHTFNYDFKHKYDGSTQPVSILVKGTPTPVLNIAQTLVTAFTSAGLRQVAPAQATPVTVGTPPPLPTPDGLSFDMDFHKGPPKHPFEIIKNCKQVQTAGLGTYTQWFNMMTVMYYCEFGEKAVHDISKTDPARYDYHNVRSKYEQILASPPTGPCKCATFNDKDPGICARCPYWGKITTPLQLGVVRQKAEKVTLPPAAVITQGGGQVLAKGLIPTMEVLAFSTAEFSVRPGTGVIWHKRQLVSGSEDDPDEDGKRYVTKDFRINDAEIYIHSIVVDATEAGVKRSYVIRKQVQNKAPEDILLSVDADLGPQSMLKWLANNAMLPTHPKFNKAMTDFMSTYLAAVQNKLPEIYTRDQFGWVENSDKVTGETYEGFVIGDQMHSARGVTPVKLDARAGEQAQAFKQAGCLDMWVHIPKMYRVLDQPFPALMLGSSFAAPFMRYGVGVATNIAFSLWDIKGGKGKSTVLEAASSIWGNPRDILQSKNDTHASRFQKYAVYRNLPIFIDEVTNIREGEASDLIYDIVNGREKSRSTSGGTGLAKQGKWDTVTLFTSNRSLYEMLRSFRTQSNATHMRVIEMQCDFKDYTGTDGQAYINTVCKTIRQNYGLAGPAFMDYCFAHPEVFEEVQKWADAFAQKYVESSDERFWLYGLGITLGAIRIAVRAGLLDYDVDGWLLPYVTKKLLPTLRLTVKTATPTGANLLSDFLNENLTRTLVVTGAERSPGQRDTSAQTGLDTYVKTFPMHSLAIRQELDTNTYYVSAKVLAEWVKINGLSLEVILQDLRRQGIWDVGDKKQVSLGKGVNAIDRDRIIAYRFVLPKRG